MGIKFLARVYGPNVWFGDTNSCSDIPRQLAKLHVTVNLPPNVTPEMKLLEKARSFYLTDKHTPYLGDFVNHVVTIYGRVPERDEHLEQIERWGSEIGTDQYPNEKADWMLDYAHNALPGFDEARFANFLANATTIADCLTPPLCLEPKPATTKLPVVVGGQRVNPVAASAIANAATTPGPAASSSPSSVSAAQQSSSAAAKRAVNNPRWVTSRGTPRRQ
jgi:hypothetical protein